MTLTFFFKGSFDTHDGVGDAETYRYLAALLRAREKKQEPKARKIAKARKSIAVVDNIVHQQRMPIDDGLRDYKVIANRISQLESRLSRAKSERRASLLKEELDRQLELRSQIVRKLKADMMADEELLILTM